MKHTELPWEVEVHNHISDEPWHTIVKGAIELTHNKRPNEIACDKYSALPQEENEANAEFIVKAVNNYYQLLDALKDLMSSSGGGKKSCGHDFTCSCAWDKAKKAIREAEL